MDDRLRAIDGELHQHGAVVGLVPRADDGTRPIIVYDGHCRFCRRQVKLIRRFDWADRLADLRYDAAIQRFPEVARGRLGDGMRVRFADGSATVGIDAIRSIMLRTPLGIIPGMLLFVPPLRRIAARLYAAVAARRTTAACDDGSCSIPHAAGEHGRYGAAAGQRR